MNLFSNIILNSNQNFIKKLNPPVDIYLTKDIPIPSIDSIKKIVSLVSLVNGLEAKISALSDQELRAKTEEFRQRLQEKTKEFQNEIEILEVNLSQSVLPEEKEKIRFSLKELRNKIFESVLPEAFACVREAAKRTLNMRHFDIQILGGIVLHEGKISEMATGEGKTLVATLPAYLNALLGKGVHIVTVNDYLARRDSEWMGPIYNFLGLSVGVIQHNLDAQERRQAYNCDIAYGTNNEFGFDYLRDNMVVHKSQMVQRPFYYAIVDEVDSILVDEARTPLIISGPAEESTDKYYTLDKVVPKLKGRFILEKDQIEAKYKGEDLSKGYDYIVDEKAHTVHLTDDGETKVANYLGIKNLHDIETMEYRHHAIQALRAHNLFKNDVDYVVKDGEVIIVDEFTGRLMPGRRWSDGLHQAVEAKEGLKIERENQTLATITFQNYFRMYEKLAGMTGTAFTEAEEFKQIYKLDCVVIPTNRKLIRQNYADGIYKTQIEKFNAVVSEIKHWYELGRPVLVGTISIDKSEHLSHLLKMQGIPHQVLNAKYHELEAHIVAQAGRFKQITIATNMAGRGTDILLGGNPLSLAKNILKQSDTDPLSPEYQEEYKKVLDSLKRETEQEHKKVVELGGLHVLGTERHEARRIDNQLRGRSGRQGDPGSSRFYISLEDDLMRLFGSDRLIGLMDKLGLEEGQVIEHPWITHSIEVAQKRVETQNFEARKHLLEYDNIMNKQREIVYTQRRMVLEKLDLKEEIYQMIEDIVNSNIDKYLPKDLNLEQWDIEGLINWLRLDFRIEIKENALENKNIEQIKEFLQENLINAYQEKEKNIGVEQLRGLEHIVMLQIIDSKWKDHLYAMDNLKEGIGLRAYGQRDPLIEYQHEAFNMFSLMIESIKEDTIELLFKLEPVAKEKIKSVFSIPQQFIHEEKTTSQEKKEELEEKPAVSTKSPIQISPQQKVGRNDPCPCGSGKKYKKCCGK